MSTENIPTVLHVIEKGINEGNMGIFDEFVALDVVEHEEMPGFESNHEGVKQFFQMFRSAFPDLHFQVEDTIGDGDRVVVRLMVHGTHEGEFMGIAPTGKKIHVNAIDIFRVADGKIAEHWGITDTMTMMQQLGAIPTEE